MTGTGTQRQSTIYVEYNYAGTTPGYTEFEPSHRNAVRNQEQVVYLDGYKGIRYNIQSSTDDFIIYDSLNDAKETTNLAYTNSYFTNLNQRMKGAILQMRRPDSTAPRPYDNDLIPAVSTNTVTGLNWQAFEGSFPWVPDFTPIANVATGQCSGLDLTVRTRGTNIGLLYTGYINVPADDTYTLYLNTDGHAFLRVHQASVLDADFGYTGGTEISATINLKAGRHPILLGYIHGTNGTPSLTLQWASSTIAKQPVPASALVVEGTPPPSPPTANPDSASTTQNTPVTIDVLANDSLNGTPGPLQIVSVGPPLGGTAATNGAGEVVYTPNASFLGTDTFTYTITDGANNATATVTVNVGFSDGSYWFPFNQTSGLKTLDAGGYASATLNGFTNDPAEWVPGKFNYALSFDGAANYISVDNFNGILGSAPRTVAAWVNTTSTAQQPVIAWGPNSAGNKWAFLIENGHARIEVTSGYLEGTRLVNDGSWHYVACAFTNNFSSVTNAMLYVDGTVETSFAASLSQTVNTTASGNVKIGSDVQSRFFLGRLMSRASGRGRWRPPKSPPFTAPPINRRLPGTAVTTAMRPSTGPPPTAAARPACSTTPWGANPGLPTAPSSRCRRSLPATICKSSFRAGSPAPANSFTHLKSPATCWTGHADRQLRHRHPDGQLARLRASRFPGRPTLDQQSTLYMRLKIGFQ